MACVGGGCEGVREIYNMEIYISSDPDGVGVLFCAFLRFFRAQKLLSDVY